MKMKTQHIKIYGMSLKQRREFLAVNDCQKRRKGLCKDGGITSTRRASGCSEEPQRPMEALREDGDGG